MKQLNFLKLFMVSLFLILISPFSIAAIAANTQTITGYWQTFDEKTKKPSSVIQIQQEGQFVEGKIIKTYSTPDKKKLDVCTHCRGSQKNKPILGLAIIQNMICTPSTCNKGTILDPRDGKIYHATMHLMNKGQALKVRGYVGMPLFGKTVVWKRISADAVK